MTKAKRHEYTLLTITAYLVGAALYTALGVYSLLMGAYANEAFSPTLVLGWTVLGGYLFFSMVSGLLFTARWLSSMRLKWKLLLMVFFVIPVYLVMLGILYSIPYGVYNYIAYRKAVEDEQERWLPHPAPAQPYQRTFRCICALLPLCKTYLVLFENSDMPARSLGRWQPISHQDLKGSR